MLSEGQVRKALGEWGGDVSAAAAALSVHRNGLYKAMQRYGIDAMSYRSPGRQRTPVPTEIGVPTGVTHSDGAIWTGGRAVPKFPSAMQPTDAETVKEIRQNKPVRVRPAHAERLRQAKLDYAGMKRVETDETAILAALIDRKLDEFLAEEFGPEQEQPKRRKRGENGE